MQFGYISVLLTVRIFSYSQKMMNDLSQKIKRSKERLLLTQMEQAAAAGMSKHQQEEVEMKIQILTDRINALVDQAEKAGIQVTRHFA